MTTPEPGGLSGLTEAVVAAWSANYGPKSQLREMAQIAVDVMHIHQAGNILAAVPTRSDGLAEAVAGLADELAADRDKYRAKGTLSATITVEACEVFEDALRALLAQGGAAGGGG